MIDAILTAIVTALGVFTEVAGPPDPGLRAASGFSVLLSMGATLPLVVRRHRPLPVFLVVFAFSAVHWILEYPGAGPVFGLLVSLYGVAAYGRRRTAVYCLVPLLLFVGIGVLPLEEQSNEERWGSLAVGALFLTAWVLGDNMRVRRAYVAAVEDRAAQLEREQDAQARRAVLEERARIARELHDVVAHSVSVMVVQAGAARRTMARDPDRAGQAIGQIESTGRGALAEMRRLVGVLRGDLDRPSPASGPSEPAAGTSRPPAAGPSGPPGEVPSEPDESMAPGHHGGAATGDRRSGGPGGRAVLGDAEDGASLLPQPGIDQLPALVGQCRDAAGLDVTLEVSGPARPLSSGIELVVYRIVQEALTNTMRHAGPAARAEVELRYGDRTVTVTVTDDGRGAAADAAGTPASHGDRTTVGGRPGRRGEPDQRDRLDRLARPGPDGGGDRRRADEPAGDERRPSGRGGPVRMALLAASDRGVVPVALLGGRGHGLTGMHERVALYGGRITAGPRAGGGFRVWAEIPLDTDDGSIGDGP